MRLCCSATWDGGRCILRLWRGSPRTMPLGCFEADEDELAELLRSRGWKVER